MNEINPGVYPTMITPYNRDGSVDLGAVGALTEWYWEKGCHGVFAVCMSSEMFRLTLREKRDIVRTVKNKADSLRARTGGLRKMSVVASGHTSDSAEDQIKELCAAADLKPVCDVQQLRAENAPPDRGGETFSKFIYYFV